MIDKLYYLHTNVFVKDRCKQCQNRRVLTTKTQYEKLVDKFNKRYGNFR